MIWLLQIQARSLGVELRECHGFEYCQQLEMFEEGQRWDADSISTLRDLMLSHSRRAASDPRDTVYALVGLTRWAVRRTTVPALLRPDYTKSFAEVARDATRCALQEEQSLRTLLHISHRSDGPIDSGEFCSWTFNASLAKDPNEDPSGFQSDIYAGHLTKNARSWSFAKCADDPNVLITHGFVMDAVESTAKDHIRSRDIIAWDPLAVYIQAAQKKKQHPDRIAITLTAGTRWTEAGDQVRWKDEQEAGQSLKASEAFRQSLSDNEEPNSLNSSGLHARFVTSVLQYARNRKLFYTYSGLLGLGPRAVVEGDVIAVLYGGHFPFVLRPTGRFQEYQFVGAAYIANYLSIQHLEADYKLSAFHLR